MKEYLQKIKGFSGKMSGLNGSGILEKKNIILNCSSVTPEEAIRACGRLLLESGCIDEGYIQAMLERDRSNSVAVGSHTLSRTVIMRPADLSRRPVWQF
ncbi:MAG: PTS transporter subunit EIIA [Lachnospiraceae bacterium]|nr:PTS transporter subunit EIIA [Lachnospiraceae bacterium]